MYMLNLKNVYVIKMLTKHGSKTNQDERNKL